VSDVKKSDEGLFDVVVSHAYGASTSLSARLTVNDPISITNQPVAPPLVEHGSATLVVKVTGTSPISYQWRKNGVAIPSAPSKEFFSISDAQAADSGIYDVVLTNTVGSVTSAAVNVDVLTGVVITAQPVSREVRGGSGVLFSVVASGSPKVGVGSLVYQWRKDGVNLTDVTGVISGADTDTLLVASADAGSALSNGSNGKYDVVVSNDVNSATSVPAVLSVLSAPIIIKNPESQVVNLGDGARFTVQAKGTAPLSYEWYKKGPADTVGTKISGATASELILSNIQAAGTYWAVVKNTYGGVAGQDTSLEARVELLLPLSIQDEAVAGGTARLVGVNGA
jgi:hypothetical protein